nr:hypothetical protein [Tanacetum cinerariifolium]
MRFKSESHEIQSESHINHMEMQRKTKPDVVKAPVAKAKANYVEVFKNPTEFGYYEHSDGIDHENDNGDDDDDGGNESHVISIAESHVISREIITPVTSSMTTFGSETSGKTSSLSSGKTSGKTFGSATSASFLCFRLIYSRGLKQRGGNLVCPARDVVCPARDVVSPAREMCF